MIEVNNVAKNYGLKRAVDNISFKINRGETYILLGTSGCGKTTTLKMLNRLIEHDEGQILIDGQNINAIPTHELRRKIGYAIQQIGLFPHLSIKDNIIIVPQLLGWNQNTIEQRVEELIHQFHIDSNLLKSFPNQLSGGQQQRVGLARALAANPDLILMDEPFGALDPITRQSIRSEFKEMEELKKKTIVMVTHDVEEAIELADRICLMDKGKIMQEGTVSDLLFEPANQFVKDFIGQNQFIFRMKTLTLNEMKNEIAIQLIPDRNSFSELDASLTFYEAIQELGRENNQFGRFTDENNKGYIFTSIQKLLQVLTKMEAYH